MESQSFFEPTPPTQATATATATPESSQTTVLPGNRRLTPDDKLLLLRLACRHNSLYDPSHNIGEFISAVEDDFFIATHWRYTRVLDAIRRLESEWRTIFLGRGSGTGTETENEDELTKQARAWIKIVDQKNRAVALLQESRNRHIEEAVEVRRDHRESLEHIENRTTSIIEAIDLMEPDFEEVSQPTPTDRQIMAPRTPSRGRGRRGRSGYRGGSTPSRRSGSRGGSTPSSRTSERERIIAMLLSAQQRALAAEEAVARLSDIMVARIEHDERQWVTLGRSLQSVLERVAANEIRQAECEEQLYRRFEQMMELLVMSQQQNQLAMRPPQ